MRTTVILFQIHYFDRWAEKAFRELRAHARPYHEFVVLMHLPPGAPVPERVMRYPHHVVRTPELRALPYPAKVGGAAWDLWHDGHTDLITLHYWRAHPSHHRYWVIEYDVRYSSPWRSFFDGFEEDGSDLLAPVILRRRDGPDWVFWPSLAAPDETLDDERTLRSFMPIFRASGRLISAVDQAYRAGWGGHLECTWATIAAVRGFDVADLGGEGEFVSPRNRGRFYHASPHDMYLAPGTMVFKPVFHRVGSRPNMLWHPVKPFWPMVEARKALLAGRSNVAGLLRARLPWLLPARWRQKGAFSFRRRGSAPAGGVSEG